MVHSATKRLLIVLAIGLAAVAPRTGWALDQLNVDEQRFNPSPHAYDFINVMSSRVQDTLDYNVGLILNWSANTMIFEDVTGKKDRLLTGRLTGDLLVSMSFLNYLSFGIGFPLHFANIAGSTDTGFGGTTGAIERGNIEGFTWGDLRLSPKVRILDATKSKVGVALAMDITAPTGRSSALATEDGVTVFPRVIVDVNIKGYRAALNIGYKWRDKRELRWLTTEPEFYMAAAVGVPIIEHNLEALGELEVMTAQGQFFQSSNTDYLEGRLALRYVTDYGLGVLAGAGAGMLSSWGSPLYRVFAGVTYAPRIIWRDRDGDGVPDHLDRCPDLWGDGPDGCPDPDRDGDGVCDPWVVEHGLAHEFADVCTGVDLCPDTPGIKPHGCPDPDRDGDGVCDPWVSEEGYQDEFAHICTGVDLCPDTPGIKPHGCPDPDRDGDGFCDPWVSEAGLQEEFAHICTGVDLCPDEPGIAPDGCPPPVTVEEKEIVIREMIHFELDEAVILPESYDILNQVADALREHPEIKKLEIRGHTCNTGTPRYNLGLSQRRAQAVVDYLVGADIERERLEARGFGEEKPIASNEDEEGRAKNRRVELFILER